MAAFERDHSTERMSTPGKRNASISRSRAWRKKYWIEPKFFSNPCWKTEHSRWTCRCVSQRRAGRPKWLEQRFLLPYICHISLPIWRAIVSSRILGLAMRGIRMESPLCAWHRQSCRGSIIPPRIFCSRMVRIQCGWVEKNFRFIRNKT